MSRWPTGGTTRGRKPNRRHAREALLARDGALHDHRHLHRVGHLLQGRQRAHRDGRQRGARRRDVLHRECRHRVRRSRALRLRGAQRGRGRAALLRRHVSAQAARTCVQLELCHPVPAGDQRGAQLGGGRLLLHGVRPRRRVRRGQRVRRADGVRPRVLPALLAVERLCAQALRLLPERDDPHQDAAARGGGRRGHRVRRDGRGGRGRGRGCGRLCICLGR